MSGDNFGFKGSKRNNSRRFNGGGPRPDNNNIKRQEANERDEAWRQLTPQQQLASLDNRLGKGQGATKQRARLSDLIERNKHQPKATSQPAAQPIVSDSGRLKAKDRRAAER